MLANIQKGQIRSMLAICRGWVTIVNGIGTINVEILINSPEKVKR